MDSSELHEQLERYHQASFGWALSCCSRDPTQAKDVLQTVYLKILEGKARFGGKATFKTWLFSVIRKTAAEERRRAIVRRLLFIQYQEDISHSNHEEGVDETIHEVDVRALFQRALADLPRRQREVLQLVFYHDLSLAEVAEVIGFSIGSARTHYERGKKRLRQWLEKSTVFHESGMGRKKIQSALR